MNGLISLKIIRIGAIAWSLLLAGCGTTYREPSAIGVPTSELVTITWELGVIVKSIDDYSETFDIGTINGGASRAELHPGEHRITYLYGVHRYLRPGIAVIDTKPGHSYRLKKMDRYCWGGCRSGWLWIEDVTTGEIVYGHRRF